MNSEIKILYNNIPFIPNSYLPNDTYSKNDIINEIKLNLNESIFIINFFKPDNIDNKEPLKFNNPNYMLFNNKNDGIIYNLPSINFYNNFEYNVLNKKWFSDNYINKLLNDLGFYNFTTPSDFYGVENEETLFYQLLEITDINTNEKTTAVFIFFFINNENEKNNEKNSYYLNKIWNNVIYPYNDSNEIVDYIYINNNDIKYLSKKKNKMDVIFNNVEYINFLKKVEYNYYLKKNIDGIENTLVSGKSLIFNSEFIEKNKNETIIINLNEITVKQKNNINYGLFEKLNIHRVNKFKSFSNTALYNSLTSDDKINYCNMKIFNNNEKYLTYYNYNKENKIIQQYYINNTIPINKINFDLINKNLKKTLIRITNKIINPNFIYTLEIYDIFKNNNKLIFDANNNIVLINNVIFTNTYYLNVYKIVFNFENKIFYIILSLCFYNDKYISTYTNDVFYNNCFLLNNYYISPTSFNFTQKYNVYQNINNLTTSNFKYYYYFINYDNLSNYKTKSNIRPINHYYINVPNIIIDLKYENNNIFNVNNILPNLINGLIYDVILINTYYNELKNNIYSMPSTLILSIVLDNNIESYYVDKIIIDNEIYKNIKYTNCKLKKNILKLLKLDDVYLNYEISLLIKIPNEFMINSFETSLMMRILKNENEVEFIKLFNYNNGVGDFYDGYIVVPKLMLSDYYNFYTLNIYFDVFNNLDEENILLFNKDNFLLIPHNEIYTKELIKYDELRLNSDLVIGNIDNVDIQYTYDKLLNVYKENLNNKYIIFIDNCFNIKNYIHEINYLIEELLLINRDEIDKRENIIFIINNLIIYCIDLSDENRNLNLTYSETITKINDVFVLINNINLETSNNTLVNLSSSCITTKEYFKKRIEISINLINKNNLKNALINNILIYEEYIDFHENKLLNINNEIKFKKDIKINHVNNIMNLIIIKEINEKNLMKIANIYNSMKDVIKYDFNLINILNLENVLKNDHNIKFKKTFKLLIALIKLLLLLNGYEKFVDDEIKKNVIIEDNYNEIKSYFEFIDRISFLKKFLNINIYCENVNINKKIIVENIDIKNSKNIEKIDLTNEELLAMNYNYVNTNYFYLNILLK